MSEFEQILDECLIYLQATDSVEAALSAYPEQAEALRPLLLAATAVQNSPRPIARPTAVAAGRQRIQAAFAAHKEAGHFASRSRATGFLSILPARWRGRSVFKELLPMNTSLRPIFTFMAVFLIGGVFLVSASGNSLPGEPLYPVKQLWQTARLALTADPQAMEESLRQERLEELRALIESGREQVLSFDGRLEAVRANSLVVDGIAIVVNEQTVWQAQPTAGQMVRLEVHVGREGTVTARRVQLAMGEYAATPRPQPTARATNTCHIGFCQTLTPSPTGSTPNVTPSHTPVGCNNGICPTETGQPTEPPTLTPSPTDPNVTPEPTVCNFGFCGTVTPSPTAAGQGTPTVTPIATATPTPCNNPSCGEPTDEPTPPNETATPLPFTATPSVTPACPPIGCNVPTETPTAAGQATDTPTAVPTWTPTPCNQPSCGEPTATPVPTDTPTPPGPTETPSPTADCPPVGCNEPTPTAVPTDTPDAPGCNFGICPTETPVP
jgi:hypothetical protein